MRTREFFPLLLASLTIAACGSGNTPREEMALPGASAGSTAVASTGNTGGASTLDGTAGAGTAGAATTDTAGADATDTAGADATDTAGADTTGAGAFGCTFTGGGTRSGYSTFDLTACGTNYKVQTNPWGGAEQTITAGGESAFTVDAMQEPAGGEAWEVATFPSIYRGTAHGGNATTNSGLPIAISAITSVKTGLSTNSTEVAHGGNSTYDVYFTNNEAYTGGAPDVYLMVWYHSDVLNPINGDDEEWNCRSDAPDYIDSCSDAGSVIIGDKTFHRFIGPNGASNVISYAPETPFDSWEFDLKDFIDDAVAEGVLNTGMYLQGIQAGFELTTGGEGLMIKDFYATINE